MKRISSNRAGMLTLTDSSWNQTLNPHNHSFNPHDILNDVGATKMKKLSKKSEDVSKFMLLVSRDK